MTKKVLVVLVVMLMFVGVAPLSFAATGIEYVSPNVDLAEENIINYIENTVGWTNYYLNEELLPTTGESTNIYTCYQVNIDEIRWSGEYFLWAGHYPTEPTISKRTFTVTDRLTGSFTGGSLGSTSTTDFTTPIGYFKSTWSEYYETVVLKTDAATIPNVSTQALTEKFLLFGTSENVLAPVGGNITFPGTSINYDEYSYINWHVGSDDFIENSLKSEYRPDGVDAIWYLDIPTTDGSFKMRTRYLIATDETDNPPIEYFFVEGDDFFVITPNVPIIMHGGDADNPEEYEMYGVGEVATINLPDGLTIGYSYDDYMLNPVNGSTQYLHDILHESTVYGGPSAGDYTDLKINDFFEMYFLTEDMLSFDHMNISNLTNDQLTLNLMFHYADETPWLNEQYATNLAKYNNIQIEGATVVSSQLINEWSKYDSGIHHRYFTKQIVLQLQGGLNDVKAKFTYDVQRVGLDSNDNEVTYWEPYTKYDYIQINYNSGDPDSITKLPDVSSSEITSLTDLVLAPFKKLYDISQLAAQYFQLSLLNLIPNWIPPEFIALMLFSIVCGIILKILGRD